MGFQFRDLEEVTQVYDVSRLKEGWNEDEMGNFYFIPNPALGLWSVRDRFDL